MKYLCSKPDDNMLQFKLIIVALIFVPQFAFTQNNTVSGTVKSISNGEDMISAYIFVKGRDEGTVTNFYGFYSLTLPAGKYTLIYSYTGFDEIEKQVDLSAGDVKLNIELKEEVTQLSVVEIKAKKKTDNFKKIEMSTVILDIEQIKKIPALLGEADVIKSIQLLPGVSTVGEGATGFNVRGGGVDQNLVLLDEAPVFNSSHLFGFFSVFNPDAVKSATLIKGGIPSQYGGRLSSILDVRMKDGNKKKFTGQGGVGLLFSRLTIEAPIVKDKGSFILAARRSYADVLAKPFLNESFKDSKFYFYDLTAKANYQITEKDKLYLSGYFGRDVFGAGFFFNWGNATSTLRWNHIYNEKLFSNVTVYYSDYDYSLGVELDDSDDEFKWSSSIVNYAVKPKWTYYANSNNTISFGLQSTYYDFKPAKTSFVSGGVSADISLPNKYALENGIYAGNEQKVGKKVILRYGVRFSAFQYLGSGKAYEFTDPTQVLDSRVLSSTTSFDKNEVIADYYNFEPRLSIKLDIDSVSSIKASYNRMTQNLHLMSNTAAATPLDIWTPSTNNIKPQLADQVAVGYFRNFGENLGFEASTEVYYKRLQNQIGYVPDANLTINELYEADLLFGDGRAYGIEFLIKKTSGKFTGWISYTFAKSEIIIDNINNSDWYPARYDRRHVGNLIFSYSFTPRYEMSANFVYNTGIPATFPTNSFEVQNYSIPQNPSSSFNNSRVSDYHRLDLSFTIYGKKKDKKKITGDWIFSVYNAYNRRNAFTIFLDGNNEEGSPQAVRYSIIGSIVPSVTYNFKF
ncbi:MAG: hypothetical protein ACJA0Q_000348 [Saprospiraceae bacterium]|jgi:hypothetical protein